MVLVHELQQYAEVYDRLDDPDSTKSRSKLCAGAFTGKSGRVFDHPWFIEERWDKRWIDNFTAWRRNGNLASFEDGLKRLPWTPAKACYRLNLSIKLGSNLEAGLYCCELSESGIRSLGPSRLPLFFLIRVDVTINATKTQPLHESLITHRPTLIVGLAPL